MKLNYAPPYFMRIAEGHAREISSTGHTKLTVAYTSADKDGVEKYTRLANVFSKQIMHI